MDTAPALERRVRRLAELRLEDPELQEALRNLDSLPGADAAATPAPQELRGAIEAAGLAVNRDALANFTRVQAQLDAVQEAITAMAHSCDAMHLRLQRTQEFAGELLRDAAQLNAERSATDLRATVAARFVSRFQLSEEERSALADDAPDTLPASAAADDAFFAAFDRVQSIHRGECRVILRSAQSQRAGLEIMDEMSVLQEAAYRRLYRWVRAELRALDARADEVVSARVQRAVARLKERPYLLATCLDEVAAARGKAVVQAFARALAIGGPGGTPRPIEIHAHDPLRYVGDMLAWIHQAVANEAELFESLLAGASPTTDAPPPPPPPPQQPPALAPPQPDAGDEFASIARLLDNTFVGLLRPFRLRLAQVFEGAHVDLLVAYRLANLLDFYRRTVARLVAAKLPAALEECAQDCLRVFYALLAEEAEKLLAAPPQPPASLAPPPAFHFYLQRLRDLVSVFDASLVPDAEREASFEPVLAAMLDPLVQAVQLSASTLAAPDDVAVFVLNNLDLFQKSLAARPFTAPRAARLREHIEVHLRTLVEEEAQALLRKCGLAEKLWILEHAAAADDTAAAAEQGPLARREGVGPSDLSAAAHAFARQILRQGAGGGGGVLALLPVSEQLQDVALRAAARQRLGELLVGAYQRAYEVCARPEHGYGTEPSALFPYSPDQVRTLLGG